MAIKNIIYLDLETTGLRHDDEFVSIAIIDNKNNILLNTLSKPVKKLYWQDAQRIHNITPVDVKNAPTNAELEQTIIDICKNKLIVIYHASFIMWFLPKELWDNIFNLAGSCSNYQFGTLTSACKEIGYSLEQPHNAIHDAIATKEVYKYYLKRKAEEARAEVERYNNFTPEEEQEYFNNFWQYYINPYAKQKKIEDRHYEIDKIIFLKYLNQQRDYERKKCTDELIQKFKNSQDIIKLEIKLFNIPVITDKRKLIKYDIITAYCNELTYKINDHLLYDAVYTKDNKKFILLHTALTKKKRDKIKNYYYCWGQIHEHLATKTTLKKVYKISSKTFNKLDSIATAKITGYRTNEYDLYNILDAMKY